MKLIKKFLVSFEGPDSSGKATQSFLLEKFLNERGVVTRRVEIPFRGFYVTHGAIYVMLSFNLAKKFPRIFHFFQFMNKFLFQMTVLPFLALTNDCIILDRWNGSYEVYGQASGIKSGTFLSRLGALFVQPDVSFVMLGKTFGEKRDEYERDDELQRCVSDLYRSWVVRNFDYAVTLDASRTVTVIHENVKAVISTYAEKK